MNIRVIIVSGKQILFRVLNSIKAILFWFLKVIKDYANFLLVIVTIALVYVTSEYVYLTKQTIEILEEQVQLIREDYKLRSEPEISILTPKQTTKKDKKGTLFTIQNNGYQATNLQFEVFTFKKKRLVNKKLGSLYFKDGEMWYIGDEVLRLGQNQVQQFFIAESDYGTLTDIGFLIVIKYDSPLVEKPRIEYRYMIWQEALESWISLSKEDSFNYFKAVALKNRLFKYGLEE